MKEGNSSNLLLVFGVVLAAVVLGSVATASITGYLVSRTTVSNVAPTNLASSTLTSANVTVTNTLTVPKLKRASSLQPSNAFACLNFAGKFYRSSTPCN